MNRPRGHYTYDLTICRRGQPIENTHVQLWTQPHFIMPRRVRERRGTTPAIHAISVSYPLWDEKRVPAKGN